MTNPLSGSSTTRTPGSAADTSRVRSVLALLITRISSGGRDCPSSDSSPGTMKVSSLCAQTITLMVT
jgi:hypothetical protein